jgi:Tfp pilus assembly protein PilV
MPKWWVALPHLVSMRTFSTRLRVLGRSLTGGSVDGRRARSTARAPGGFLPARNALASEVGDTLLEVIVSALLLGIIVVGTFTGLNSTNRATSIDRARSQADALAQQDEDRLRSLPVTKLKALEEKPESNSVTENGAKYEVASSAKYVVDSTATTSCATTALSAEYIETTSTVTSNAFGATKPVVETGIVSPPPDTSLIAQVTGPSDEAVAGMEVQITGPQSASAVTSTNGCGILAVSPGEYKINIHQTGFVDQNWFAETEKDSFYPKTVYLPAETTTKKPYTFGLAANVKELKFEELNPATGVHEPAEALNAVLENPQMAPTTRLLEPEGSSIYLSSITTTKRIFPFPVSEAYTVYAGNSGSCVANIPPEANRTKVIFPPGGEQSPQLLLPSLIVKVYEGTVTAPGKLVSTASEVFLSQTDSGCESTYHEPKTVAPVLKSGVLEYPKGGALEYAGQPWGTYTVCVTVPSGGSKHYSATGVKNNDPEKVGTPVNLYEGSSVLEEKACP